MCSFGLNRVSKFGFDIVTIFGVIWQPTVLWIWTWTESKGPWEIDFVIIFMNDIKKNFWFYTSVHILIYTPILPLIIFNDTGAVLILSRSIAVNWGIAWVVGLARLLGEQHSRNQRYIGLTSWLHWLVKSLNNNFIGDIIYQIQNFVVNFLSILVNMLILHFQIVPESFLNSINFHADSHSVLVHHSNWFLWSFLYKEHDVSGTIGKLLGGFFDTWTIDRHNSWANTRWNVKVE